MAVLIVVSVFAISLLIIAFLAVYSSKKDDRQMIKTSDVVERNKKLIAEKAELQKQYDELELEVVMLRQAVMFNLPVPSIAAHDNEQNRLLREIEKETQSGPQKQKTE